MKNNNHVLTMYRYFLITAAHIVQIIASACFVLAFAAETAAENNKFLKAYGKKIVLYLVTYGKRARTFILETFRHAREKGTTATKYFLVWFHDSMEFRQDIIDHDKYIEMI